ncbi:hypothetical protein DC522_01330 [Microvirga sp. KLBC 81]|uniref:hypothetical protein n=1 Tax=Microvirga sp. KLBC 81 TaxID=1862707 RepID=UPI000D50863D|nr:hypothetical protein [Microvirga sp. KLBC 81]PVE26433.1 hypothetical protein DC522_01330 [Microvirga sp. KLBC 81]
MSNITHLPAGLQITVAYYDGAWRVRAYRNGRRGPAVAFSTREDAESYAVSLARIIRHNDAIHARNERLNGGAQ